MTARSRLFEVIPLTSEHRPGMRFEAARIAAGGGRVHLDRNTGACRLQSPDGNFSVGVSRSLGGFAFGRALSCEPSVRTYRRQSDGLDLFLVAASDGVASVLRPAEIVVVASASSLEVTNAAAPPGGKGAPAPPNCPAIVAAAHRLRGWAYALGSRDHISVAVVDLSGHFGLRA